MIALDIVSTLATLKLLEQEHNFFMDAVKLSTNQTWTQINFSKLLLTVYFQLWIEILFPVGELTFIFLLQMTLSLKLLKLDKIE